MKLMHALRFIISSTLLVFLAANAQAKDLQAHFNGLNSFEAKFTQKLFDADQQLQEESSGTISVKKPNKFRLEYSKPYKTLYVADGKKLWSYDEDLEQVIVKSQRGLLDNSPAMILSDPGALNKNYSVSPQGMDNGMDWYELKPKHEDNHFDQIQLGFDKDQLRIMELQDGFGQTTRLELKSMQKNLSHNAAKFRFKAPKGVDIIKQ